MLQQVLTKITPRSENCFVATRNPANGMIASLGTGKIMLSMVIPKKTVMYPVCEMNAVM